MYCIFINNTVISLDFIEIGYKTKGNGYSASIRNPKMKI